MYEFTVKPADDNKKLIRVVRQALPRLTAGMLFKALRQRDIQINGQRTRRDIPVNSGDIVRIYLPAATGQPPPVQENGRAYTVVFEDSNYLILNKKPHIMVQPGQKSDEADREISLIEMVRRDLSDPDIKLCHRLDRQTGGLIVLSRNPEAWKAMQQCMRRGEVVKRYQCLVLGVPDEGEKVIAHDGIEFMKLEAWLEKDAVQKKVYLHASRQKGDKHSITLYRILQIYKDAGPHNEPVSHLEVELQTGRTHQIRAQFAYIGNPLLGDSKYGQNQVNRHFTGSEGYLKRQQLTATNLVFLCRTESLQSDIAGRSFTVDPDFDWPVRNT